MDNVIIRDKDGNGYIVPAEQKDNGISYLKALDEAFDEGDGHDCVGPMPPWMQVLEEKEASDA